MTSFPGRLEIWMRKQLMAIVMGIVFSATAGATFTNSGAAKEQNVKGSEMAHDQLFAAAANDEAATIRQILGAGAPVDPRNAATETPLLVATHKNAVNAARVLIEAGADVNAKDRISDSPYLYAGARGRLEILRMALAHGADLKSTNRFGGTAIIPAAERGHVETVRTLIAAGADVDHVNNLGWTALIEAIILADGGPRHVDIVQALVDAGANVNLADREGVSPLKLARDRGYAKIAQILVTAGAR